MAQGSGVYNNPNYVNRPGSDEELQRYQTIDFDKRRSELEPQGRQNEDLRQGNEMEEEEEE